jgi:hypothetical protein
MNSWFAHWWINFTEATFWRVGGLFR